VGVSSKPATPSRTDYQHTASPFTLGTWKTSSDFPAIERGRRR